MSSLSSADQADPSGNFRIDAIIFDFPSGSDEEYGSASSKFRKHQYARYSPLWENAGCPWPRHFASFGIRLVSSVSAERRLTIACSSVGNKSLKAIHLPSGDQLIRVKLAQGIRLERNFRSGPPSAGTT